MRGIRANERAAGEPTILGLRLEEVAAAIGCAIGARVALSLTGTDLVIRFPLAGPALLSTLLTWWAPVLAFALCWMSRLAGGRTRPRGFAVSARSACFAVSRARAVGLLYAVGLALAAARRLLAA